jgi:hypothetical protein
MGGGHRPRGPQRRVARFALLLVVASCGARTALDVDLAGLASAAPDALLDGSAMSTGDGATRDGTIGDEHDGAPDARRDAPGIPRDCVDVCKLGQSECRPGRAMSSCLVGHDGCLEWDPPVVCGNNRACVASGELAQCIPIEAPRPIAPRSTSRVTSQRPTFTWALGAGDEGAEVTICADRNCTDVVESFVGQGSSAAPPMPLAPGVHYWRLRGVAGDQVGRQTSATWEFFVGPRNAPADTSWGTTLDVNGDGFADVVVGSPFIGGNTGTGAIDVFQGGPSGASAIAIAVGAPAGADPSFGATVASAGDVNGDGFGDVVVGAPGWFDGDASQATIALHFSGAVYVFLGSATGLTSPAVELDAPSSAQSAFAAFGNAVAGAGDVNGDGYADIVVGADQTDAATGAAYVYLGGPSGISTQPMPLVAAGTSQFGQAVAGAGDLDGDGLDDVLVVGTNQVYVYRGTSSGPAASPAVIAPPLINGALSVALGDVNGDGFVDVVAGSEFATNTNTAFVYLGGPKGLTPTPLVLGATNGSQYSYAAAVGDVNGDGFADIILSAGVLGGAQPSAYVYLGSSSGPSPMPYALTTPSGPPSLVNNAGDVNGDGFADVIVGGVNRAYLFFGAAAGPSMEPVAIGAPNATESFFGRAAVARAGVGVTTRTSASVTATLHFWTARETVRTRTHG